MKHTWHGHFRSRIQAVEAEILIDQALSDAGTNPTYGGER